MQEVFLAATKGIKSFDEQRGTLITWLLGIAHRRAALFWRQKRRRSEVIDAWLPTFPDPFDEIHEDRIDLQEMSDAVRSIVALMPEDAAAILIGRYLEDRSTTQLASEFGITEQAVRSRLSRARDRFRQLFEKAHEEFVPQ